MSKRETALWGAFGAAVPEILKYYKLATQDQAIHLNNLPMGATA